MRNMTSGVVLMATLLVVLLCSAPVLAGETDCVDGHIRKASDSLTGMSTGVVVATDHGILVTFERPQIDGMVAVSMTSVGEDLVTFQKVLGRKGVSDVSKDELVQLVKFFDSLHPDADFMACPEICRDSPPKQEQAFAVMKTWWDLQQKSEDPDSKDSRFLVIVIAIVAVLLIVAFSAAIVLRRNKSFLTRKAGEEDAKTDGLEAGSDTVSDDSKEGGADDQSGDSGDREADRDEKKDSGEVV